MDTKKIALLLLAAGASKRMGTIKQLLPWKGSSMIGHAIGMAQNLELGGLLVVLGAHADMIKPECVRFGADSIENLQWQNGLGSSIARGIKELVDQSNDWEAVLIMLGDQPLFDTNYFNDMITSFHTRNKNIIATRYGQHAGVPAIFGSKYFKNLLLLENDQGAKNLINMKKKDVFIIDSHDRNMDIDTIDEYLRMQRLEN